MATSRILVPGGPVINRPPMAQAKVDPAVGQLLTNLQQRVSEQDQAIAFLTKRLERSVAYTIVLLRQLPEPKIRISIKELEEIQKNPDIGVNDDMDDHGRRDPEYVTLEAMTRREYELRTRGLFQGEQVVTVPAKSPFEVVISAPEKYSFHGEISAVFEAGKMKGRPLALVKGKSPKHLREFAILSEIGANEARLRFSTDSEGQQVKVTYTLRYHEDAAIPEPAVAEEEFQCVSDWHKFANDGDKIIGRCCPDCGDSRKMIAYFSV